MHGQDPAVTVLDCHLQDQQSVSYDDNETMQAVLEKGEKDTKLTAWFKLNSKDAEANDIKYLDISKHYVWKSKQRVWSKRKKVTKATISRMNMVHPTDIERFSMRLLLLNIPGAKSFEHLRTVDGHIFNTFHEAAAELKLLADDKEWFQTLSEAISIYTDIRALRELFASILKHSQPSKPAILWDNFKKDLCQDILYHERLRLKDPNIQYNNSIYNAGLIQLDMILKLNGRNLTEFPNMTQIRYGFIL